MKSALNITRKTTEIEAIFDADLGMQRQQMTDALARFGIAESHSAHICPRGRLLFGLDLTASREASLEQARIGTAAMFDAIASIGNIKVKLAWYRGKKECKVSQWYDDPAILSRSMRELSCMTGLTQIAKILRAALAESTKLSGVVFVGDHCEERCSDLTHFAEELGKKGIPLFIFHECVEADGAALLAKPTFEQMAKLSGGAYMEFGPDSGAAIREALTTLAAFAVGGMERVALPRTAEALQLRGHLLLGSKVR